MAHLRSGPYHRCSASESEAIVVNQMPNQTKRSIPFKVEDGRLVNPARSLAILHLNGIKRFTPYRFLNAEQKAEIETNVLTVASPISNTNDIDMDQ